jgi:hypothetical protein
VEDKMADYDFDMDGGTTILPPPERRVTIQGYPGFSLVIPEGTTWSELRQVVNKMKRIVSSHIKDNLSGRDYEGVM